MLPADYNPVKLSQVCSEEEEQADSLYKQNS